MATPYYLQIILELIISNRSESKVLLKKQIVFTREVVLYI